MPSSRAAAAVKSCRSSAFWIVLACWRTSRESLLRPSLSAFSTTCGSRTRPLPSCLPGEPLADVFEVLMGAVVAVDHLLLGLAVAGPDQQALVRPIVVEPPQGELDLAVGEPQAQVIAGHRLQRMGLVEDHDVVLGQHAARLACGGPGR